MNDLWKSGLGLGAADDVIAALDRLPDEVSYDPEAVRSERIRPAIVLFANGNPTRFRRAVELARADWRDLLMAAGLAYEGWEARMDEALDPANFDKPALR